MKKTYIAPKTNVVEFKASSILAGSATPFSILSAGNGEDAMSKENYDDDWD